MVGLSKSRIIFHRQCPKRLWLLVNRSDLMEATSESTTRMTSGIHLGDIARSIYSDGILIKGDNLKQALDETQVEMARKHRRPIFEATYQHQEVLIRADLLLPDGDQYRMIEVKSSTSVKECHLEDAAIQAWTARNGGLNLSRVEIAHINRNFVYPGDNCFQGLLTHVDITDQIKAREEQVPAWIDAATATLSQDEPAVSPGTQCSIPFECPFVAFCNPPAATPDDVFPVEILPHAGALIAQLHNEGYADIRDVPKSRFSKTKHQRIWRATKFDRAELAPQAGEQVRSLGFPRYYLDFETMQFTVPIWTGTRPYDQVPFQWSCHHEISPAQIEHHAFLASGNADPRRPFVTSLIERLGHRGAVVVYNAAFERTRLQELATAFSDLRPAIERIIERIFDLLPVAREHYYHPDMRGSWSIKAVLPTIAPELAYDGLEVADGGMAQEAFAEIMHPETSKARRAQLRQALLTYCQRDTLAMVKIAHYFQDHVLSFH